jgi:hypothetical protein
VPVAGLAASTTVAFGTAFPNWSRAVTVMTLEPTPATIEVGLAESVVVAAETKPGLTVT